MNNLIIKIELAQIALFFAALMPLYGLIMQIIKAERKAALEREKMTNQLTFVEKRLDSIENWIATNSGLRLPK
ncbi:MAG: hypothetical protein EAZ60_16400 [Oscillatoriales cyanobacterium]|uniref:hypothetical protein n=1 Tax=unclassified Microcoleus TaxID=2642155 RepID=UPI001DDACB86|nr:MULTISPECIES: hypothetical protein [unclassified Microcoleus]TAE74065.1 MAG: hypothetical protein EAZ83_30905 [Oscillatoriales cyanobacterium]MCC3464099.1 hypothetical protein [Microcoleus sp. PH2017_11_PCY_U_A]MCC3482413.1 hypothetical protein [Microcoleus sp. PH2017_12_PCY_D_A]MCC3542386.1 hypothetical protein [Microcoleus sp. PH2017_22_RUC_O_B]MCC3563422.1 hypothetical protein [Microcoleus sp. PH2017_27_LUM_O_A]